MCLEHGFPITNDHLSHSLAQAALEKGNPFKNILPHNNYVKNFRKKHNLSLVNPQIITKSKIKATFSILYSFLCSHFDNLSSVFNKFNLIGKSHLVFGLKLAGVVSLRMRKLKW